MSHSAAAHLAHVSHDQRKIAMPGSSAPFV
jgi:hypothetical protein